MRRSKNDEMRGKKSLFSVGRFKKRRKRPQKKIQKKKKGRC